MRRRFGIMEPLEVLAVVVSYNGGSRIEETISSLLSQVNHIHIVDNGSDAASVAVLKQLCSNAKLSATFLPTNTGIGHALNIGVAYALDRQYQWILTMDQDSVPAESMVNAYRAAVTQNPGVKCLTPIIVNHGGNIESQAGNRSVAYAITSGNFVNTEIYRRVGLYRAELFIDCVDFDFSLRIRSAGYEITRVAAAILNHKLGEEKISGIVARVYCRHSPLRRYYMFRNMWFIVSEYWKDYPKFCAKFVTMHIVLLGLIPFMDKDPMASINRAIHGTIDFFSGKHGKMNEQDLSRAGEAVI
jgi:rhamnosyltransferase